jgi:outer membrane protein insertion porin family
MTLIASKTGSENQCPVRRAFAGRPMRQDSLQLFAPNPMLSFNRNDEQIMKQYNRHWVRIVSFLVVALACLSQMIASANAQSVGPGMGYTYSPSTNAPPNAPPSAPGFVVGSPYGQSPAYGTAPAYGTGQAYSAGPGYGNTPVYGAPAPAANGSIAIGPPASVPAPPAQAYVSPIPTGQPVYAPQNNPPPITQPWQIQPENSLLGSSSPYGYKPNIRDVAVDVYAQEGQTGRFSVGGSVNSDLGVAGQFILEERNFDIMRWPGRPSDMLNGAFRGAGQNFRMELVPGNQVQRYTLNWTEPNLFGYSPFSLSVGGFYFTRIFRDWTEQRLGGRVAVGYEVTPDLSLTTELRGEDVKIKSPRVAGLPALDRVVGSNDLYTGRVRLAHNTRDSPFLPTEGHLLELIYDQSFGEFDFPRGQVNLSRYFLVRERADGTGRHTFTSSMRLGFTGSDTPLFENFFAGGFSTLRGFQFRGAGPVDSDVQVGGRFQMLGTFEYMMPVTADEMLRMVAFVDYGTVERDIEINWDNFRVAPGIGARIAIPALGPAPLAFDFAFPVAYADSDSRQIFSFTMGLTR